MAERFDVRLADVFRAVFELSDDTDPTSVRQGTTEAWDSLGHVSLVTALESEFEIEISTVDSIEITSFEMAQLLVRELAAEQTS